MSEVYKMVKDFKRKYPLTWTWWRLKKHSKVVQIHVNPDEVVNYAFAAQKNRSSSDIFQTCVVAVTNKRIIIGQKRVTWGYFFSSITPDLFNDIKVSKGIFWGNVDIDTIKEEVILSNIDHRALDEIETAITSFMMEEKKKYKYHHLKKE